MSGVAMEREEWGWCWCWCWCWRYCADAICERAIHLSRRDMRASEPLSRRDMRASEPLSRRNLYPFLRSSKLVASHLSSSGTLWLLIRAPFVFAIEGTDCCGWLTHCAVRASDARFVVPLFKFQRGEIWVIEIGRDVNIFWVRERCSEIEVC